MVNSFLTLIEKKYHNKLDLKGLWYVNFALEGAKNMRQIILDLLSFSRISGDNENHESIEL
jgi:light-regulated signal transduction histidine kinase (bacteriophytochrome)